MQQSRKPLDPGGDGALQLGVLRKEEEEDVGNDILNSSSWNARFLFCTGSRLLNCCSKNLIVSGAKTILNGALELMIVS